MVGSVFNAVALFANLAAPAGPPALAPTALSLSVSPEALVVADATLDAPMLIAIRIEASDEELNVLFSLDEGIAESMALIESLQEALAADPGLAIVGLAAAIDDRDALILARTQVASSIATAIVQDLPAFASEGLARWRSAAAYRVPPEFRVLDRSAAEWRLIERAYRRCVAAEIRGESPDPTDQALIAAIVADPMVAAARSRLLTTLEAMTAAYELHLGACSASTPS